MREGARKQYRSQNNRKNKKIYFLIFALLIITFVITSIISIKWLFATHKSKKITNDIISKVTKNIICKTERNNNDKDLFKNQSIYS